MHYLNKNVKTDYEVIVIGAGPAGVSCAKHLTDNGIKTLIIEKQKLPKEKTCSGLFERRSIIFIEDNFAPIPENFFYTNKILDVKISKTGKSFIDVPELQYWNLDRKKLDYWLLKMSNTDYQDNCFLVDIDRLDGEVKVTCNKNGRNISFSCNYVVGADGVNSRTRKLLDKNYKLDLNKVGLVEQHIYKGSIDLDENTYYASYGKKFRDLGMACVFKRDNHIIIAAQYRKEQKYFMNWLNRLQESHNAKLELVKKEKIGAIRCRLSDADLFFGKENILLAGEANGLISVYTGGISSALISGKAAAAAIVGSTQKDVLPLYKQLLVSEIEFVNNSWTANSRTL